MDLHYLSYKIWLDENHRLGGKIEVKLKAVQKYEAPKSIEEYEILFTKTKKKQSMKEYMKLYSEYGPSDADDED